MISTVSPSIHISTFAHAAMGSQSERPQTVAASQRKKLTGALCKMVCSSLVVPSQPARRNAFVNGIGGTGLV